MATRNNQRYLIGGGTRIGHKGRGLASRLGVASIRAAENAGSESFWLEAIEGNDGAERLYRKLGFEVTRKLDCYRLDHLRRCGEQCRNNGLRGSNGTARSRARLAGGLAGRTCVNLDGTFLGCRYAIGAMRAKATGSIINISSRSGFVGIPAAADYASSNAAVRNHTKSVALYCAEQGLNIRCNSIHPAAILTPMWEPMLGNGPDREARMAAFVADTPMRRFGMVEEVASIALLLASDEAAYMIGTELTVDGGLLAGLAAAPEAD